jgi:hypothetical protein
LAFQGKGEDESEERNEKKGFHRSLDTG